MDEQDGEGGGGGVQSAEIGLHILDVLSGLAGPQGLSPLARACGLQRAKAHRYLVSLERAGFVEREPVTGRYLLGRKALRVGLAALAAVDVVRFGSEALPALVERIGEAAFLSVWAERGPTILRWEDSGRPVTVNVRVGSTMPLLTSATGRIFAAFLPRAQTRALIDDELARPGARRAGLADMAAVDRLLAETARCGLGRVAGEMLIGVEALCAPVFAHDGRLAGSLTALGTSGAFDSSQGGPVASGLKAAAGELSGRLGHRPTAPKVMAGLDPAISVRPTESES